MPREGREKDKDIPGFLTQAQIIPSGLHAAFHRIFTPEKILQILLETLQRHIEIEELTMGDYESNMKVREKVWLIKASPVN